MSPYKHLTMSERETIFLMHNNQASLTSIAQTIGRATSTVSRELSRNRSAYSPSVAQERYEAQKSHCGRRSLLSDHQLLQLIRHLFLDLQWSPEEIAARLKLETSSFQISYTTIYRGIYSGLFDQKLSSRGARGVIRKLRHHGKSRHKKGYEERRGKIPISHTLQERPESANKRTQIGHWELDTVAGKTGRSCVVTMVDRCSRYLIMHKAAKKNSASVTTTIRSLLKDLPPEHLGTITPDRGKEFAKHHQLTEEFGIEFYFPNPHAPWQRGSNENTNGLIREYLPKNQDMDPISDTVILEFVDRLNKRPRKCLNWKTPYEIYHDQKLHLI